MAINDIDDVLVGFQPPVVGWKYRGITATAQKYYSTWYMAGVPGAGAASSAGVNGELLSSSSSPVVGQISFPSPSAGVLTYLAKFGVGGTMDSNANGVWLCDRIWQNSGLSPTSLAAQTLSSVAFARDNNGTSAGAGICLAVEVATTPGAGTPTFTVSYTNSQGTSGRTATNRTAAVATAAVGSWYPLELQGSDIGVQSVQSLTLDQTWSSGTFQLVAYRQLAHVEFGFGNAYSGTAGLDPTTIGLPLCWDGTVPFLVQLASSSGLGFIPYDITFTRG